MSKQEYQEPDFIAQIICTICAWANSHGYDEDDVVAKIGEWLVNYTKIATCKNFQPNAGNVIRAMNNEELAQFMLDIAYENTSIENGETYMRIPSPFGGYLVDGIIDLHDTDVVVEALREVVEDGKRE